ncbi:MAG: TIGR01548 family HAD-type hydrolase [Candidatus Xenobia bacterium]
MTRLAVQPVPAVAARSSYHVPKPRAPLDVHLDTNEGAIPSMRLVEELAKESPDLLRRYPEAAPVEALLAAHLGVRREQVLVTAGADDALDRCCRAVIHPGQTAVIPMPTFEMLERFSQLAGARIVPVSWPGGRFPLQELLAAITDETALVGIISPNNPTGSVITPAELQQISQAAPHALILVDMAYGEFADQDLGPAVLALPNAVMVRTMSKAWGLAGLRVGYVAGPTEIVGWLRTAGAPYPLSGLSLAIAERLLQQGSGEMEAFVKRVRDERAELHRELQMLAARVEPSQANFLLARFANPRWVVDGLAGLGIGVRPFPGREGLENAVRISLPGHEPWFARLICGVQAVLAPEALLFDMDGVLADVSGSYRKAIVETARHFGAEVTSADVAAAKAEGNANNDWVLTQRLLAAHGIDVGLEQVTERFEALYQGELHQNETLLAEREFFKRQKLPLAVVTGRPRQDAMRFLERHGLADLFRVVVTMEDGPLKPDPAPVRLAMERLGVRAAWMVGDTPDDVRAARAAGVVPIGVPAPGHEWTETDDMLVRAGAARVLHRLEELEELLP